MSNKPQHTPGPWDVAWGCGYPHDPDLLPATYANIRGSDNERIATVWELRSDSEVDLPNADLIAAAPDLLTACKAAREDYDNINYPTATHQSVMKTLDAAIAKAESEGKS